MYPMIRVNYALSCTDCGACVQACIENERAGPGIFVVHEGNATLPLVCYQCRSAPCIQVCPTQALFEANSVVSLDLVRCIHCGLCALACPFGAIELNAEREPMKCSGCKDREAACARVCPTGILTQV